jgi:hypothetical protein
MSPRRGVFEAHELAPGETVGKEIVERINDLFGIDRVAREDGYDFGARRRLRAEHAPKLLTTIKEKMEAAQQQARLPASWVRRWPTRSDSGRGWRSSSNTRKWN